MGQQPPHGSPQQFLAGHAEVLGDRRVRFQKPAVQGHTGFIGDQFGQKKTLVHAFEQAPETVIDFPQLLGNLRLSPPTVFRCLPGAMQSLAERADQ